VLAAVASRPTMPFDEASFVDDFAMGVFAALL